MASGLLRRWIRCSERQALVSLMHYPFYKRLVAVFRTSISLTVRQIQSTALLTHGGGGPAWNQSVWLTLMPPPNRARMGPPAYSRLRHKVGDPVIYICPGIHTELSTFRSRPLSTSSILAQPPRLSFPPPDPSLFLIVFVGDELPSLSILAVPTAQSGFRHHHAHCRLSPARPRGIPRFQTRTETFPGLLAPRPPWLTSHR